MKVNLPQRQKLLVLVAAVAVALLVLDRVAITPLTNLWQSHATEIAQLRTSVANGRVTIQRGPRTQKLWADMQSGALPKDPAQAEQDLISAIDRWGRGSGVELGSIRPQWKRGATSSYSLLECRVDGTGNLSALSRFLYELERSPLALRIDSVDLTSRDDYGSKMTVSLVVSGLRLSPLEGRR